MSLLQISDPAKSNEDLKKFVVGIDLGTTNSLIASYDSQLIIYDDNNDSGLIPSVVTINDNGDVSEYDELRWNDENLNGKGFIDWKSVKHPDLKMVVLMHMSETNNHPEIAKITALQALGESSPKMILAQQDHPTELLSV